MQESNLSPPPALSADKEWLLKQQIDTFPILPATVIRVLAVTSEAESSAQDLAEVILPDQSLALSVLKIANSVLFGRPRQVDSLKTAIMVLGFDEVRAITLGKAVINSFSEVAGARHRELNAFWEHGFLTGLMAKRIAQHLRLAQGTAFLAGLIHDVGKLVMLLTFAEQYEPRHFMVGPSTADRLLAERRRFSFSHDLVADQLLEKWTFPETLLAAAHHHLPEQFPGQAKLALLVQLADLLAHLFQQHCQDPTLDLGLKLQILQPDLESRWRRLGLPWEEALLQRWFNWLSANQDQRLALHDLLAT